MKFRYNIATLLCGAVLIICSGCTADEPIFSLNVGDTLPPFEVIMNDGSTVSDKTLAGFPAEIIFFNTSCPDCRRHLPKLEEEWQESKAAGKKITYICISRAEKSPTITAFWAENGLTMPWSAQADNKVYSLFASSIIPRVYSVSPTGIITRVRTGEYNDIE